MQQSFFCGILIFTNELVVKMLVRGFKIQLPIVLNSLLTLS